MRLISKCLIFFLPHLCYGHSDQSDIYVPIYSISSPLEVQWASNKNVIEALPNTSLTLNAGSSILADFNVFIDGNLVFSDSNTRSITPTFNIPNALGVHSLVVEANQGGHLSLTP
jgi:hypothetical protein